MLPGKGGQDEVTGEGTGFFSTQPSVDNVVQHKRSVVEQEVVFRRARAEGRNLGQSGALGGPADLHFLSSSWVFCKAALVFFPPGRALVAPVTGELWHDRWFP